MFSRKDSLPSPSLEDSFFPLSSTSSHSLSLNYPSSSSSSCCQGGSGSMGKAGLKAELEEGLETDLILAAELGQALLERNEELAEALIQRDRHVEVLQQEKHVLRRRLEVCELSSQQREAELTSELSSLLAELDRHHSRGQGQKREENTQLTELANHNHRLVEELAEAVSVEHSLRVELRSLREEMEDSSLSKTISSTQLDNTQAENRVLKERLGNMEEQLRLWQEDCDRLRGERERQRERLTDLQTNLREREAQLEQEQSVVFELRTLSRSLERRVQRLEEDTSLDDTHTYTHPLSLLSEIQQTQVLTPPLSLLSEIQQTQVLTHPLSLLSEIQQPQVLTHQWRLLREGRLLIMSGTEQMEWHQKHGNHGNHVFDTIQLIWLQPIPQACPPQLRCHQPPLAHKLKY